MLLSNYTLIFADDHLFLLKTLTCLVFAAKTEVVKKNGVSVCFVNCN